MALGAQLPIRLDREVEERLELLARQAGTTKSALVRLLVSTFVAQATGAGGRVQLPPDWAELLGALPAADRRSHPAPRRARAVPAVPAASSGTGDAAAKLVKQHVPAARARGGE